MLVRLALAGVIVLTLGFVVWVISELREREAATRVIQRGSGGDSDVTDFRFGWKLALVFFLGLPVLTVLWHLVLSLF